MRKKKKILKKDFLKLKEKRNSKFLDNLFEFYNIETTNKKGIWIKENDKLVKYKIGKGDIIDGIRNERFIPKEEKAIRRIK